MKANELMIGNIVTFNSENVIVKEITEDQVTVQNSKNESFTNYLNQITPINITEDWLKKFGFIAAGHCFNRKIKSDILTLQCTVGMASNVYSYYPGIVSNSSGEGKEVRHNILPSVFRYVHDLQNYFFAITRQELIFVDAEYNKLKTINSILTQPTNEKS